MLELFRFIGLTLAGAPRIIGVESIDGHLIYVTNTGRRHPEIRGGADEGDPNAAQAIEVPEDLTGLDDAALRDLHGKLQAKYLADKEAAAGLSPREKLAATEALAAIKEQQKAIAAELTERIGAEQQSADRLAELDRQEFALPDPNAPAGETEEDKPAPTGVTPSDTPADTPAPAAVADPSKALTAAQIAAARGTQTTTERAPSGPARTRPRVAMVASANQQEFAAGAPVDLGQIGQIVDSVKWRLDAAQGRPRALVAGLPSFDSMRDIGVELLSESNSTVRNDQLIEEATLAWQARRAQRMGRQPTQAMTAAICDPLDIIRDVPDYSNDSDPFGDAFPQRPAGRLGFQFTPAMTLAELAAGVQAGWDDADQALVDPADPATWKPVVDLVCPPVLQVKATAVTAGIRFDTTTEMSNPERVKDALQKLAALRVRVRTQHLLSLTDPASIHYNTADTTQGAWSDVIYAIESTLARATYAERMDVEDYTIFLPPGLPEGFVADQHQRAYLEENELASSVRDMITRLQQVTGCEVVQMRDETANPFGALPAVNVATPLPAFPLQPRVRIIPPGTALYFSTGEIQTGIETSPELMRMNKREWFSEEFVGIIKHGSANWFALDLTVCPSGARAGLLAPRDCVV